MKNRRKILILLFISLLIFCLGIGYYLYPKTGTLNGFLLNNYNKENIEKIEIRSTISRQDKSIEDKDEINEILSKFSNVKLARHYGNTSDRVKGAYYIYIYDKNGIPIEVNIQGEEYVNIINDSDKSYRKYRIIDNSLDVDYINELIS